MDRLWTPWTCVRKLSTWYLETTSTVIPAEDAKVGDILLIRPGDRIPLDGIVIEGESRLDTSPITGEPVPVGCKCR